jgi:demethylmenaquinone methyltransferase/2-methoxy-6-polyprenyl-1,4-benzoquinol methylase
MDKFDHFNLIGPIYDWVFGKRSDSRIINLTELEPHHFLLDVGGGTGRVTEQFSSITPHTIIADPAMRMLYEAKKKGITTVNAHAERLPFAKGSFNRVIIVDAFHHVVNQQETLEELWRCLVPGGRMIIEEPDIRNWLVKLIALGEKLLLMRSRFRKPQEIAKMCSYNDAETIQILTEKGIAWIIIIKSNHK